MGHQACLARSGGGYSYRAKTRSRFGSIKRVETTEKARKKAFEVAREDEANLNGFDYLPYGKPLQWQVSEDEPIEEI